MKLTGEWNIWISTNEAAGTSTESYGSATEVEINTVGPWLRFMHAGRIYFTSHRATLQAVPRKKDFEPEGD